MIRYNTSIAFKPLTKKEKNMRVTFLGADHEVTGSMHYVEAPDIKFLVDCGMEQGRDMYENMPLPVVFGEIDYILLTHAHIDHSGMIPWAYKNGFKGSVITTEASMDLDSIMLLDSAHIQESEAEWKNRKAMRAGGEMIEPPYTVEDARAALKNFKAVDYDRQIELSDSVKVRFTDAGHLLGSASIEIWITEKGETKKFVFSGDIGNKGKPLIRDPKYIKDADYVIMESTYGDRLHDKELNHVEDLTRIIQSTLDRGGNVVIPAFAVGRTQELLYLIRLIKDNGYVKGHDNFPVYVDSPLAIEATQVFKENLRDCYDAETKALVEKGINPIGFPNLHLSVTADDSKAINFDTEPKVIIAASGMCDAGRIRHHLKHNLWRPECSVVFAGYQSEGTLGRILEDGADHVKIFGEEIQVRAHIETMGGMSSHADQKGLLEWICAFEKKPRKIFLVHGDDDAMHTLGNLIEKNTGIAPEMPYSGSIYDFTEERYIVKAEPEFIRKKDKPATNMKLAQRELNDALNELKELVLDSREGANADVKKLARAIKDLVKKFKY